MLRWVDGFDHQATSADVVSKWGSGSTSSMSLVAGRNGGQALSVNSFNTYVKRTFDNQQFWYAGCAYSRASTTQGQAGIIGLYDGANEQISLIIQNNNKSFLAFGYGGVNNLPSTGGEFALAANTWYYLEIKVKITNSVAAGDAQIYVNGTLYTSLAAGQSTRRGSANNYANAVIVGNPTSFGSFSQLQDDVYICDGQGATNNGLLGPCYVSTLRPSGAGSSTQWTPNTAGANYTKVNETTENGDTSYVSTSGVGNRDSYTVGGLADNPKTIFGVQAVSLNRADAAETTRTVCNAIKSGASFTDGAPSGNLTATYSHLTDRFETDPATGVAWTKSGVAAVEAGVKLVS